MTGNGCLITGIAHLLGVFTLAAGHFLVAVDTFFQADAIRRPPIGSSRGRDTVKAEVLDAIESCKEKQQSDK